LQKILFISKEEEKNEIIKDLNSLDFEKSFSAIYFSGRIKPVLYQYRCIFCCRGCKENIRMSCTGSARKRFEAMEKLKTTEDQEEISKFKLDAMADGGFINNDFCDNFEYMFRYSEKMKESHLLSFDQVIQSMQNTQLKKSENT
jgi:hypothetical protein